MNLLKPLVKRIFTVLCVGILTVSPVATYAEDNEDREPRRSSSAVEESPTFNAMIGDLLVARPMGLVITTLGTATFAVSLPFTVLGGNWRETAEQLVVGPAKTTFLRCMGCKNTRVQSRDPSLKRVADPY